MEMWEWAWLAGIYEGEGTLGFGGRAGVQVRIGMTDEDVIQSVHHLFPGNPWRREMKNRIKPLYIWQLSDRDEVVSFLMGIYPFLHRRRRLKVEEALVRLEKNLGAKSKRTHCKYGHPLSGDNLYVQRTTGARSCVECRARRDRERKRRRAASP